MLILFLLSTIAFSIDDETETVNKIIYTGSLAGLCPEGETITSWEECKQAMTILFGENAYSSVANLADPSIDASSWSWFDGIPSGCSYRTVGQGKQVMFSDVFGHGKEWAIPICETTATFSPSADPTINPSTNPTINPTLDPTMNPSTDPTVDPTTNPSTDPTVDPTIDPTTDPTIDPTADPTTSPSTDPTVDPTVDPTTDPTMNPTLDPTMNPSTDPTIEPTLDPTVSPSTDPTLNPTVDPTLDPTAFPTFDPTVDPTFDPTLDPTAVPSFQPTAADKIEQSLWESSDASIVYWVVGSLCIISILTCAYLYRYGGFFSKDGNHKVGFDHHGDIESSHMDNSLTE
jgi:hypothetical protein